MLTKTFDSNRIEMTKDPNSIELKALKNAEEIRPVEDLQRLVWTGSETEIVPMHMLLTVAQKGGILIGAYHEEQLVGFVFGFLGVDDRADQGQIKHCSHMLGVHPAYRDAGVGAKLKRAQWQLVRHQGLELITWTYDPLESRNANLNIAKLGAVCNTYQRDIYGPLEDDLNAGLPTDRFQVDWWVNSPRVLKRLNSKPENRLSLAHYLAADVMIINETRLNDADFPTPYRDSMDILENPETRPKMTLFEIPANFQAIKAADLELAHAWRMYSRVVFELFFNHGYMITDFVFLPGKDPRGYYLLSHGEATMGV